MAGDGGCLVWPQAAGMLRARRHLLTGDPLDAPTAYQLGIVTDVVDEPDEVLSYARKIAARIAALPPLAVQGTKQALNRVSALRADEVVDLAFELEEATLVSDDLLEGIAAFREGRAPTFTGAKYYTRRSRSLTLFTESRRRHADRHGSSAGAYQLTNFV